jgi:hypothetical protein
MDQYPGQSNSNTGSGFGIINIIFVFIGLFSIYYLYKFLYSSKNTTATTLINSQQSASMPPSNLPTAPTPFEGGEYSVNTWVYISSFNKNLNTRKHIFEIRGQYFSTLLIALGAFKNNLTVRTHSIDVVQGFQSGSGSGSRSGSRPGSSPGSRPSDTTIDTTEPPNAGTVGSLASSDVDSLFTPMAMDDALLDVPPMCDLPEIDLQRWTMITVVLSGRTIDVYLDGKLSRSCTSSSYYKVDPTGVTMDIVERGGFDGYIGNTMVGAYSMNPDEIYRAYLSGPQGSSMDILNWVYSLFSGSGGA